MLTSTFGITAREWFFTHNLHKHLPPDDALSVCGQCATCFRHRFSYVKLVFTVTLLWRFVNKRFEMYFLAGGTARGCSKLECVPWKPIDFRLDKMRGARIQWHNIPVCPAPSPQPESKLPGTIRSELLPW